MRKNPFSIYDFLGYVFPGALALYLAALFWQMGEKSLPCGSLSELVAAAGLPLKVFGSGNLIEDTVLYTILSYVTGHLIAYLSSLTVEQFSIWTYDYPSRFLLERVPPKNYWKPLRLLKGNWNRFMNDIKQRLASDGSNIWSSLQIICKASLQGIEQMWPFLASLFWRVAVGLFLLPVTGGSLLFGKVLCMKRFYVKRLDKTLRNAIRNNRSDLARYLGVEHATSGDFHRIIYHYEYERMTIHAPKLDNYVALYGFLRSLVFIFDCLFLTILIRYALPTIGLEGSADPEAVKLLLFAGILTYIFFMGFMKFYRRFTLEGLMCLVVDTSYKQTEPVQPHFYNPAPSISAVQAPQSFPLPVDSNSTSVSNIEVE